MRTQHRYHALLLIYRLALVVFPQPPIERRSGYMQRLANILNAMGRVVMQCLRHLDFFALTGETFPDRGQTAHLL